MPFSKRLLIATCLYFRCQDYAAVNAYRHGSEGSKGKLLYEFGKLIQSIKNHELQYGCPAYFVAENVILNDKEEMERMEKAYTVPLIKIDAKNVSPCYRNRSFWTSVSGNFAISILVLVGSVSF